MTGSRSVKARTDRALVVAVIASPRDLRAATRLRRLPDLFEVRLDALARSSARTSQAIRHLRVPIIITARHPLEGGHNNLPLEKRRALLLQFLPWAHGIDIELRSAGKLAELLAAAKAQGTTRIISVHHFKQTPTVERLEGALEAAIAARADIFKVVTRTDATGAVDRLMRFFQRNKARLPICVMGTGRLGREARLALAAAGSVLHYVHLGKAQAEGQLSLQQLRRMTKAAPP